MENEEWYETWFDTHYYHILYKDRNYSEAEKFITNLLKYLELLKNSNCLDLACGKGRHSIFLNKHGLNVTGLDLSEHSISFAKPFENETLKFDVHDMRDVYEENEFDIIFNLFTSFGYFEDCDDNNKVLDVANKMLVHGGRLVIDFMNVNYVLKNLVEEEVKTVQGIDFHISRESDGKHIVKYINFQDKGHQYRFKEKVQVICQDEFMRLLNETGFEIIDTFGDINLTPFDEDHSDRLIIIAKKK